jgi:ATP-dependent Clp protease adaptor protein ClpS
MPGFGWAEDELNRASEVVVMTKTKPKEETKTRRQPPYNVVLLNDDDHTVEYVVAMMTKVFGYPSEKGVAIAKEVHEKGRCIVWTGALEVAEFKQEMIHSYGPDKLIARCKGSMTAILEEAAS